jgi:hypothetical protein
MTDIALAAEVAASQARWRAARRYLNEHRHELSQWAARHPMPNTCGSALVAF